MLPAAGKFAIVSVMAFDGRSGGVFTSQSSLTVAAVPGGSTATAQGSDPKRAGACGRNSILDHNTGRCDSANPVRCLFRKPNRAIRAGADSGSTGQEVTKLTDLAACRNRQLYCNRLLPQTTGRRPAL
jgi:hypothetical protein